MEQFDVFDCSNVLIASYFADDRECAHENREHTLIYQCSGRLENVERKPFCIREIVPLCGVITECGCKRGSGRVSLIVPLC